MNRATGLLGKLLKFGMPLCLILVPVLAVYGWVSPWQAADKALARDIDQTRLLVGISYSSHYSLGRGHTERSSRSYIFLPAVLRDPKIVTVTEENSSVTTSESAAGLFFMLAWLALCAVGTWWFWFRRVPPNNSFKPNLLRGSA